MATLADRFSSKEPGQDVLSGTPRAHALDRWIYVVTAALFIVIILTGFIPDSLAKIAAVSSGARAPFPMVLHMHAVLMASFMLLLLTQTVLVATGKCALHMKVGVAAFVVAPALILVGIVLVPTMYHQTVDALRAATAPAVREKLQQVLLIKQNIMLLQLRQAILFPLFLALGLKARELDAGLHKRMMILASAMPLNAAIDRIEWLPTTMPATPYLSDLYILVAVSPMFFWDAIRNHRVHRAYWLWLGINLPIALVLYHLWDTKGWHAIAQRILGA